MRTPPKLKNTYICIADRHAPELTAMVSSYLAEEGYYLPLFEIQGVTAPYSKPIAQPHDKDSFSQLRAIETCRLIQNAIVRMQGCENIILIGLSDDQKSYLQLPEQLNIISVDNAEDVHAYLSPFFDQTKPTFSCRPEEALIGLQQAVQQGYWLKIDPQAAPVVPAPPGKNADCVVIENDQSAMAVLAVNYAVSVGADIIVVGPLEDKEDRDILYYLADWKPRQHPDPTAYDKIEEKITDRIGQFDFSGYEYTTFFTAGLPYHLLISDQTCCTYVNLQHGPDHFTFTNIFYAEVPGTGAAVLFSPLELNAPQLPAAQREIDSVSKELTGYGYHLVPLLSKQATLYNFSRYLQYYPYDLLHICTHGGEIAGKLIESEFIDSQGGYHIYTYDRVLSFAITPFRRNGEHLLEVHHMVFPRSYNGVAVGSAELEARQYSADFFIESQNAVINGTTLKDTFIRDVEEVTDSRSIMCNDYPFHAMIKRLAGSMKPVIFNNTCWSWGPVSHSFLEMGARGYIGTLWRIKDSPAAATAGAFYQHVKTMSVAKAIQKAASQHQPDDDLKIYVFYGFPFTRLHPGQSPDISKKFAAWFLRRRREGYLGERQAARNKRLQEELDFILAWYDEVTGLTKQ
ncbi:CHAT domain-containing protein [Chitinophaga varians]|uniref:CHAT domain-containing protein n=1 Tax=Chitinophaga varians TaxID=2202339 RepID=A0A847RQJ5_9BACT|nr:CHAT domain-containing protein [Chitinophaga varians]NLR69229.1 CHAT domain-containing protein [Chitinophaga varians]